MTKFLDLNGLNTLVTKIKAEIKKVDDATIPNSLKGAKNGVATLDGNGYVPLTQLGNLDTTFAEVVTSLPTDVTKIKKHLYLVKNASSTESQNVYSEYIYIGEIGTGKTYDASKWEKLGEFKASIDLSGYATKLEAVSTIDKEVGDTYVQLIGTYANGSSDLLATIEAASSNKAGVMTADNFNKLQSIAEGANRTIVDSALSESSTNPVQNKVIKAALDGKADSDIGTFTVGVGTPELIVNASTADSPSKNRIYATGATGTADIIIQHSNSTGAVDDVVKVNVDGIVVNAYSAAIGGNINNLDWTLTGNKTNITGTSITSPKFVKTGGTSQQALMADGSVATRITEDEIKALFN